MVKQVGSSHAHVRHLCDKAARLHGLARKAKFWWGEEDVEAGVVVWDVACRPILNYGGEVLGR